MTNIIKYPDILLKVWVAWDISNERWHRPHSKQWKLMYGVWPDKETLQRDIQIDNYDAVCIDMSQHVPADITRIANFEDFDDQEKHNLAIVKLRQLITVFVFRSSDIHNQLINKYKHKQLQE